MQELDEPDKQKALNQLLLKLQEAENSVITEGTISADELEEDFLFEIVHPWKENL